MQGRHSNAFRSSEQVALIKLTDTFPFLSITLTGACSSQHSGLSGKKRLHINYRSLMEKYKSLTHFVLYERQAEAGKERIATFQVIRGVSEM